MGAETPGPGGLGPEGTGITPEAGQTNYALVISMFLGAAAVT